MAARFLLANLTTSWLRSPFFLFSFLILVMICYLQCSWQFDVQFGLSLSVGHNTQLNSAQCCTWNGCWNCYRLWNCTIKLWILEANWCDSRWSRKKSNWLIIIIISLRKEVGNPILILTKQLQQQKESNKQTNLLK